MTQELLYAAERQFDTDIDTLWKAWTDAAQLEAWYHPTDLQSVKGATESDLRIGGMWACAVDVPAHNMAAYFYGTYKTITPNLLIEHTMHYTESKEEFDKKDLSSPSHLILLNFEAIGDNSWVKFSQFGELPEGHAERAKAGMESYFDSLENFLKQNA